ncbi:unnamed protein product [Pleuronectes platessa]|uniref:Uncharacterized protein n=1 Tax=Pleuronectes platessa TaxID=8262 RepID=A0A9N7TZ09_PLEPL|nr:unnamed protein product [Pleuronectes platessa]
MTVNGVKTRLKITPHFHLSVNAASRADSRDSHVELMSFPWPVEEPLLQNSPRRFIGSSVQAYISIYKADTDTGPCELKDK